jgi:hypothetical protein
VFPTWRATKLVAELTITVLGFAAGAQFPDELSTTECPGCAAVLAPASFEGIWSTALTAVDEPHWAEADFFCFAACTDEGRAHAARLLADERYAGRSALELYPEAVAANVRSVKQRLTPAAHGALQSLDDRMPSLSCDRRGFGEQAVSPLPIEIERQPGRFVLRYEELGVERTILLEGHAPRPDGPATSQGASIGRLEQGTLVVETTGIAAGRLSGWLGSIPHSEALRATERYSLGLNGRSLELVLELDDPETFTRPLVVTKRWLRAPRARRAAYQCDVMSGGLEGVFAEYLDPHKVDARRRTAPPHTRSP